jgi:hypothetical protein
MTEVSEEAESISGIHNMPQGHGPKKLSGSSDTQAFILSIN